MYVHACGNSSTASDLGLRNYPWNISVKLCISGIIGRNYTWQTCEALKMEARPEASDESLYSAQDSACSLSTIATDSETSDGGSLWQRLKSIKPSQLARKRKVKSKIILNGKSLHMAVNRGLTLKLDISHLWSS